MKKLFAFVARFLLTFLLIYIPTAPQTAIAQDHVVPPSDIQKAIAASSSARQKNQAQLLKFVSTPEAQQALKTAHIDVGQVKNAIPTLTDEELAQLSSRSEQAQKDFVAGRMSDRDLIIILLAVVALILIIVAVR
jgi:hypothetical protein